MYVHSESGDVFSTHVINNPDLASERELVQAYAPSLSPVIVESLTAAFSELRKLNDEGLLAYPYSTREIVAVAKHLQVPVMSSQCRVNAL